jgi:hypothetical protein
MGSKLHGLLVAVVTIGAACWQPAPVRAADGDGNELGRRRSLSASARSQAQRPRYRRDLLEATGQIRKTRRGFVALPAMMVDTSQDPKRARELKAAWTATALERMRSGADGSFGYSLFAVSRADLQRLRDLHLQYVRAMQSVIAGSDPNECVGLYCAQLLSLEARA